MLNFSKPRGATAIRNGPALTWPHLAMAGLLIIAIVIAYFLFRPAPDPIAAGLNQATILVTEKPADAPVLVDETLRAPPLVQTGPSPHLAQEPPSTLWRDFTVRTGDNLSLIFKRAGFSDREVYQVVNTAPHGKELVKIYPGHTVSFRDGPEGGLSELKYQLSALETIYYRFEEGIWLSHRDLRQTEVRTAWATGEIESSLFLAGTEAGLSINVIMAMANVFGGVIDFVMDPRKGDQLHLLYEEHFLDGVKVRDGNILAASYTNRGKTHNAFRYTDASGRTNYYSEDGVSMRRAFLLAPVDFTRVSSSFNLRRLHPIYKTVRPHRGIDYAAPRGTPVYAAGDGRVIKSGYTRANGNYVFIKHGEQYVTHYLHLHKRKVSAGQNVAQGQVIGTVGATGAATGPHLHYEFLLNGVHRNPRTIHKKLPKAKSLPEAEMPRYLAAISSISTQLAALQKDNYLALNSPNQVSP